MTGNPTCAICKQPIRAGDQQAEYCGDGIIHLLREDCIAAAVRRCRDIADKLGDADNPSASQYTEGFLDGAEMVARRIEVDFPEVFRK